MHLFSLEQVMLCDNLSLPFRDESLDAVLSVAVIHHIATAERRVRALRELARVIRVGGKVMISVWAMEQRHRKVYVSSNYSGIHKLFLPNGCLCNILTFPISLIGYDIYPTLNTRFV